MIGGCTGMNIIEVLWDRLFGKPVVLTVMETSVRISQGRKAPEYELPKNCRDIST